MYVGQLLKQKQLNNISMATTIKAIPFDIAAKEIGKDKLMALISRGIVKYARRSTHSSQAYIELDSLPQRFLQAYLNMHHNPVLSSLHA